MSDLQENQPDQQSEESIPAQKKGLEIGGKSISFGVLAAWIGIFALLALLAFGLLRNQEGPVTVGETVPNFTLTTFDGEQISLRDLKGKVVVLNFWASWCKPCEEEAADLESAWRIYQLRDDVVFLGVDYVDTEPEAKSYLEKFEISYPNGPDLRTKISQAFRIRGVPETYIIGKDGKLAAFKISPFLSLAEIQSMIDPLLES
ncbi:MAG: TlpA family protein disulfide reductase [Anaerolineales bacterium]|jgi:cytochrome c biogenesis protein CcmG/thiol:disulfide interchange protein DsbE